MYDVYSLKIYGGVSTAEKLLELLETGPIKIGKSCESSPGNYFSDYSIVSRYFSIPEEAYRDNIFTIVKFDSFDKSLSAIMFFLNSRPFAGFAPKRQHDFVKTFASLMDSLSYKINFNYDNIGIAERGGFRSDTCYRVYCFDFKDDNKLYDYSVYRNLGWVDSFTGFTDKTSVYDEHRDANIHSCNAPQIKIDVVRQDLKTGNYSAYNAYGIYKVGAGLGDYCKYELFVSTDLDKLSHENNRHELYNYRTMALIVAYNPSLSEYGCDKENRALFEAFEKHPYDKLLCATDLSFLSRDNSQGGEESPLDKLNTLTASAEEASPLDKLNALTAGAKEESPLDKLNALASDNSSVSDCIVSLQKVVDDVLSNASSLTDKELQIVKSMSNKLYGIVSDNSTTSLF